MGLNSLAEAIILQSMEDLWSTPYRKESVRFFREDGFKISAEIAGLNRITQRRLLLLLTGILKLSGSQKQPF